MEQPTSTFLIRLAVALVVLVAMGSGDHRARAQSVCLPAPRLLTTMPMGGQAGTEFEVVIAGDFLEDAGELRFSHPGIAATLKTDDAGHPIANHYLVKVAADCPVGIYDARVVTRLGISTSRAFSIGNLPEIQQTTPNSSLATAIELPVDSVCNSVMTNQAVDFYRFEATQGQRLVVECCAKGIDSKMNAVLIVGDEQGRDLVVQRRGGVIDFEVPEDGRYTIKVHDLTYKGGPHYFYRLVLSQLSETAMITRMASTQPVHSFSWPPVGLAEVAPHSELQSADVQKIELPCDITGSFYPAADVDVYEFDAKQGDVWWVEVASERLGRLTDPSIVVQHVATNADGSETLTDVAELSDIPSPVKVSSNGYSYDGPPYNAGSSDILGKIEVKHDGLHRLQLTDLFGGTRSDPANVYRMVIRKANPDFAVVAWALHMNLRNGDRNALSKPMALRPGTTMPLEVVVVRRDGFDGPIDLQMTQLPDGVTAQGVQIAAGKSVGTMLVTADPGAPPGLTSAKFTAVATINDQLVERSVRLASMAWPVPNAWSEVPEPRLLTDVPVSVGRGEPAPITIAAKEDRVFEVTEGQSLTVPLLHLRQCEFSGAAINMKTFGCGFDKNAAFDLPLTADSSEAVFDLAKLKTPPGQYTVAFYGSAVAKYRHNVEAVDAAKQELERLNSLATASEEEAKRLAAAVNSASESEKAAAQQAADAASAKLKADQAAVAAAQKRVTAAENAAKPKDIVDIIVSKPITIRVVPAEAS